MRRKIINDSLRIATALANGGEIVQDGGKHYMVRDGVRVFLHAHTVWRAREVLAPVNHVRMELKPPKMVRAVLEPIEIKPIEREIRRR